MIPKSSKIVAQKVCKGRVCPLFLRLWATVHNYTDNVIFLQQQKISGVSLPGGNYWDYYPDTPSINQIAAIHFMPGHP